MKTYLGIELGSTRIKAVAVDEDYRPVLYGSSTWKSDYADGIWTYPMEKVWSGLRETLQPFKGKQIARAGISGMMHGLLAFDEDWRLLAPFRTWQNTITGEAAEKLTALFNFNIPQRWSIAHLYQAVLNDEPYTDKIAHITTLSGYVHYMLTGVNVVGVGEASGMFPIDSTNCCFDRVMLGRFDMLAASQGFHRKLRDILPPVLVAGQAAGSLTAAGAELLDGALPVGLPFAPPEGDAGTGMVATNSVAERTGNISAGTSIFTMVVLETPIRHVYPEIDMVTTPAGRPVAMVHCNNGTNDMNMWSGIKGMAAVTERTCQNGSAMYIAARLDDASMQHLYARTLKKAGVSMYKLPYGVERHTREADGMRYVFYLNDTTGPQIVSGVEGIDLLTGEVIKGILTLEPYGVACVKE